MERNLGIKLVCYPKVYAPAEDTYLMLTALTVKRDERVLEMGCGPGLISIHMAKAGALVTAVDLNPAAVDCTKDNASRNDLLLTVINSDLFSNVNRSYDLIVFNPPYLRGDGETMEDHAWAGGPTGTEVLFRFLQGAVDHLEPNGRILVIVSSDMDQAALEKVLRPFKVTELASMRLFFEQLRVLELRPVPGRPRSVF